MSSTTNDKSSRMAGSYWTAFASLKAGEPLANAVDVSRQY
ncbi:hypothetical protein B4113_4066 [Geobacillus sp. B4113_201601]|nr:hypothetical protein B4113_4066 [Geobacillus sp. B4113_201601]